MTDTDTDALTRAGLTSQEAQRRHRDGLGNAQPEGSTRSLGQILAANVFTHFNAIVFAGFGILLALGRWQDALFGLPALFNTVIGVVQEYTAKRTLDRLAVLNAPTARVRRDGTDIEIPPAEVVLGDVLVLRTGDQITADARVLHTARTGPSGLEVDESLLTGESDPIRKRDGDELLSGSSVIAGSAAAEVTGVGAESYAAKLTVEARKFSLVQSELRGSINRLLRWISWGLLPLILIVATGQMRAHGGWASAIESGQWVEAVVGAVAAVIAMVPLGLVLITSIAFAVSAVQLARNQVLIQELPAVEGLARVDVLCLDKTGTLTTGDMDFHATHLLHAQPGWEGVLGYLGSAPDANGTARHLAAPFAHHPAPEVGEAVPFDSARKWAALTTRTRTGEEADSVWVFGAPEFVLPHPTTPVETEALARAGELAEQGLRTLLLAHTTEPLPAGEHPVLPGGLAPVVLVTFQEQVREDAAQTLGYFAQQGVEVRVISGDDPRTVAAVARQVGLADVHPVDARTLPEDPAALAKVMESERVFGRVTPTQKRAMVHALQHSGHVVAMTGDGVNDALAIKDADLGIAMDTATAATKAVARVVLLDGRFDRMPGVVAEGRRVIANVERVSMLFLTKTTYALTIGVVFGLLAWAFPFLPRQLSITDGLTIGIPAFFLALMPNATRYRPGFLRRSLSFAIPAGLIVAAALTVLHLIAPATGAVTTIELQSASTLTLAGVALWVLAVLARPAHPFRIAVVAAMYAGLGLIWVIPFTRDFFQVTWLPTPLLIVVAGIVAVGIVLVEILRAWHRNVTAAAPGTPREPAPTGGNPHPRPIPPGSHAHSRARLAEPEGHPMTNTAAETAPNVLLVWAHPRTDSLTATITSDITTTLRAAGVEVEEVDLYRSGFDPVLHEADEPDWADPDKTYSPEAGAHSGWARSADALVFVFPVWWYSLPAVMKGYIDRVWNYGQFYGAGRRSGIGHVRWIGLAGEGKDAFAKRGYDTMITHYLNVGVAGPCGIADSRTTLLYDTLTDDATHVAEHIASLREQARTEATALATILLREHRS